MEFLSVDRGEKHHIYHFLPHLCCFLESHYRELKTWQPDSTRFSHYGTATSCVMIQGFDQRDGLPREAGLSSLFFVLLFIQKQRKPIRDCSFSVCLVESHPCKTRAGSNRPRDKVWNQNLPSKRSVESSLSNRRVDFSLPSKQKKC